MRAQQDLKALNCRVQQSVNLQHINNDKNSKTKELQRCPH